MPFPGKIAVVGTGSVGGYYGARLARQNDVSFLLRSDLGAVRENGLTIKSPDGDFVLLEVQAFGATEEIGPVDLVIIALKTTSNHFLPGLIPPLLKDDTILLTLQNGLGNEEFLAGEFPGHPVLGGLCFVCINRTGPGQIHHIAHGLIEMGDFGETSLAPGIAKVFHEAGIPCDVLGDLGLSRWRKLIWNVPFNGLSIAGGGIDVEKVLADPELFRRTRALMQEVTEAAAAYGYTIDQEFAEENINRTLTMGPYQPSSLVDYLAGREVEVESIWGEPLRRAKQVGVETPELEKLYLEIREKSP